MILLLRGSIMNWLGAQTWESDCLGPDSWSTTFDKSWVTLVKFVNLFFLLNKIGVRSGTCHRRGWIDIHSLTHKLSVTVVITTVTIKKMLLLTILLDITTLQYIHLCNSRSRHQSHSLPEWSLDLRSVLGKALILMRDLNLRPQPAHIHF